MLETRSKTDFENQTYWVLPGEFLAGPKPSSKNHGLMDENLKCLLDQGVTAFFNLMTPDETNGVGGSEFPYKDRLIELSDSRNLEVEIFGFPIKDFSVPTMAEMKNLLESIEFQLDIGKSIFVHCWGGLGRTGTVVGCFLKSRGIAGSEDVFEKIAGLRGNCSNANKPSPENDLQKNFVIDF